MRRGAFGLHRVRSRPIPGRIEALLRRIAEAGRRRVYRALAAAYFYFFDPARAGIKIGGGLSCRARGHTGFAVARSAERTSGLRLRGRPAANSGAGRWQRHESPDEVFADVGLRDPNSISGLRADVYRHGLRKISSGETIANPLKRLETLRNWMFEGGEVRFEHLRAAAVRAALDPFGDSTPEKSVKDQFLGFVLSLLGDPRSQPARWNNCAKSERIARRWLTEAVSAAVLRGRRSRGPRRPLGLSPRLLGRAPSERLHR